MSKILGIDLGTTNSVIAIIENNEPLVILNKRGDRLTPSVVAFGKNNEVLVGKAAKNQAVVNANKTVMSIKRKMGTFDLINIGDKKYTSQEISAKILSKLKEDAEDYLGEEINKAVITVPAYFNDNERQATKEAGIISGFEVMRIINEPTAAALAYGVNLNVDQTVLIYDLGGGTFDVSILEIGGGVFEVKATSGNNKLGGDDFDQRLIDLVLKRYKKSADVDLSNDIMALQKLKEEVEKVKIDLSHVETSELNIPFISADDKGPKHLNMEIKRSDLEELIQELIEETISLTKRTINDAKLSNKDIDKVILVGGSTRIPYVQKKVEDFLGKEVAKGINPDECVALGAAIQASILSGEKKGMVLVDVTPLSLGIEIEGGIFVPIIDRNSTIPTVASKLFTTIADYQKSVEIRVYQGERIRCVDNISLGQFQLSKVRPAKKGSPRIEVNFSIDTDGVLQVNARDLDTGDKQEVIIKKPTSLSEKQIQKIIETSRKKKKKDLEYFEIERKRKTFETKYQELKDFYQIHMNDVDNSLRKEVQMFIRDVEKIDYENNHERIIELSDNIDFLHGELKAVCMNEKEEVEIS